MVTSQAKTRSKPRTSASASEVKIDGKLETALDVLGKEILLEVRVNPGSMSVILVTANML